MAHGTATNSIELSGDAKSFDRVARKWNVDYAFYKTGPDKYLLFFKEMCIRDRFSNSRRYSARRSGLNISGSHKRKEAF